MHRRVQPIREDAGEYGEVWVRVAAEDTWPDWRCECNQLNDGWRVTCAMCGTVREDIDQCR